MNVENAIYPQGTQLQPLMADKGGPIVMVNLLKFRAKAQYKDGRATSLTGREAYNLYAEKMVPFVAAKGGRIIFSSDVKSLVIGAVEDMWDVVALMEYPSSAAFAEIAMSPEVAGFGVHREAGLAGQLLIRC